jgi:threonine synthase
MSSRASWPGAWGSRSGACLVATNANDILHRTLETGTYEVRGVVPTTSPSMDIQVSSNFERLLFEAHGRDPVSVRRLMSGLAQSGSFSLDKEPLDAIRREFDADSVAEHEVEDEIASTWRNAGYLLDPHTAIGVRAARRRLAADPATPVVALATAHPRSSRTRSSGRLGSVPACPRTLPT